MLCWTFVPNEEKIFRPQVHDSLSNDVKRLLRKQNKMYKKYKCNGFKIEDKASFDDIANKCTVAIKNFSLIKVPNLLIQPRVPNCTGRSWTGF